MYFGAESAWGSFFAFMFVIGFNPDLRFRRLFSMVITAATGSCLIPEIHFMGIKIIPPGAGSWLGLSLAVVVTGFLALMEWREDKRSRK